MIEIKTYGPDYEELHKQFATQHWTKRKRTTSEYIYWKFRGVPGQQLNGFILAIDERRVVGQLGLVPCIVEVDDQQIDAQWACDLMVDPTYRGKGVAKMLYEYAASIKPLTLGSDASPAATISMKRAGFISLTGPWKFFFPLWLGEITKLKGYNSGFLNNIRNPFIYPLLIWRYLRGGREKFRKLGNDTLTDFLQLLIGRKQVKVLHDYSFSAWRYSAFKDYYKGVNVFAKRESSFLSLYKDRELFFVTEWGAKNFIGYLDAWSEVVGQAYDEGVLKIKVLANTRQETAVLSCAGNIKYRTRTDIIFYTAKNELRDLLLDQYFYYTYLDSDENI